MNRLKRLYRRLFSNGKKQTVEEYARSIGVKVGDNCRLYSSRFGSEPYLISIGDHVTVTAGVQFITHDGGVWVFRPETPADYVRPIIIHSNSFIGMNSILLPGAIIGPNSIVGAGSVVTKTVPPNTVVAGVPARVISTLEEYRHRIHADMLINRLTAEEKRDYLLKYFGATVEEWLVKLKELETHKGGENT